MVRLQKNQDVSLLLLPANKLGRVYLEECRGCIFGRQGFMVHTLRCCKRVLAVESPSDGGLRVGKVTTESSSPDRSFEKLAQRAVTIRNPFERRFDRPRD